MTADPLTIAREHAKKMFEKNPNRSVSATFRFFRKKASLFGHGDFAILATIVNAGKSVGAPINRQKINYAINASEELSAWGKKEKTELIESLSIPSPVQIRMAKNVTQRTNQ